VNDNNTDSIKIVLNRVERKYNDARQRISNFSFLERLIISHREEDGYLIICH